MWTCNQSIGLVGSELLFDYCWLIYTMVGTYRGILSEEKARIIEKGCRIRNMEIPMVSSDQWFHVNTFKNDTFFSLLGMWQKPRKSKKNDTNSIYPFFCLLDVGGRQCGWQFGMMLRWMQRASFLGLKSWLAPLNRKAPNPISMNNCII